MMRFYEGLRQQARGEKVFCLNCGATNPASAANCENCDALLQRPAPFYFNLAETIIRPLRALPRIAATAPIMQALLVVVVGVLVNLLVGSLSIQFSLDNTLNAVNKYVQGDPAALRQILVPSDNAQLVQGYQVEAGALRLSHTAFQPLLLPAGPANPSDMSIAIDDFLHRASPELIVPGPSYIIFYFIIFLISWLFFSVALYYTLRLLYRDQSRSNFLSLAAVAGFARITSLLTFVYLLPSDATLGSVLSLLVLIWQLVLLIIGTKASSGLSYNRAAIAVAIPVLLFQFLLRLPV